MPRQIDSVPKLGLTQLSGYMADLLLAGAGEEAAVNQPRAHFAWRLFFYSLLSFLVYHLIIRVAIVPSIDPSAGTAAVLRLLEAIIYAYLIVVLTILVYCHYRYMLLPRLSLRFRTIAFFLIAMVLLFSRLYYSLYHINPSLFSVADGAALPTSEFGIHGRTDLAAVLQFALFSGYVILNSSYSTIQPHSLLTSTVAMFESGIGWFFMAILIATFVEIASSGTTRGNSNEHDNGRTS